MIIDTHSHLNSTDFDDDIDLVIKRALTNDVFKMLVIGFDTQTNKKALDLCGKYRCLYATQGIHPSTASQITQNDLDELETSIKGNKIVAVGECGLDYYWNKDNSKKQIEIFIKQIELAIKYNLPLVIHMRDATSDMEKILRRYQGKIKGVMHGYSGSLELMKVFIDLGMYIALGGPVTFKNAILPKVIAKHVPLNRLLMETDCPYLTPQKFRGQRNEPSYLHLICEEIAMLRDLTYEEVASATTKNAIDLFRLEEKS